MCNFQLFAVIAYGAERLLLLLLLVVLYLCCEWNCVDLVLLLHFTARIILIHFEWILICQTKTNDQRMDGVSVFVCLAQFYKNVKMTMESC